MDFRVWLITLLATGVLSAFNIGQRPPEREIQLTGEWRFMTGYETGWEVADFDDSGWSHIHVPSFWEDQGRDGYDGIARYRRRVIIPSNWKDASGITLEIGKIADEDRVFINGNLIGTGRGWTRHRSYSVPRRFVNFGGENVIAVWVNDLGGKGGIWEGPVRLRTGMIVHDRYGVDEF